MPRPAGVSDRQPVEAVAVLVDVTPELVDSPMPTGLAGAEDDNNGMPPLTRQAGLEGDLSMIEEVVADLDFCDSVIGGPTSAFLSSADGIVDLAGDVTVGVSSPADLAGGFTVAVAPSTVTEVASSADFAEAAPSTDLAEGVTVGVASSTNLAGDVTVGVSSPAVAEVASSADLAEVASSADLAEDVTVVVTSLANPARVVTTGLAFQGKCDVLSGYVCDYDGYYYDGHYNENPDYFDYDDP